MIIEPHNIQVVYHHNDPDGWASAAIIAAPVNIGVGYTTKINNSAILNSCTGKNVAIVDFSFPEETMKFIQKCSASLIWIDHHESSAPLKSMGLPGIHDEEFAGCILTWRYFCGDAPIPDSVKYIGDRDIWKFEYPETESYAQGLNTLAGANDPISTLWQDHLLKHNNLTPKICEYGQVGINMIAENNLWHSRLRVHLVTRGEDKFILTNGTTNISELSDYLIKTFKVDKVLIWDIAKGALGLHGRGKGVKDFFGGLLKGHQEACGGQIPLPDGWKFLEDLYAISRRISP